MMTTVETDMTTVAMTMDLPDGVHMSDPHLGAIMTPTWTDALHLAETTMAMVVIHTEVGVLEDLPQGIAKVHAIWYGVVCWLKGFLDCHTLSAN